MSRIHALRGLIADTPKARRVAVILAVAGVVLAFAVLLGGGSESRPPGVGAAVSDETGSGTGSPRDILHYRVTSGPVAASGGLNPPRLRNACEPAKVTEIWQTSTSSRWRARMPAVPQSGRCGRAYDPRRKRLVRGPVETSWHAGTTTRYVAADNTLDVVRGYPPTSSAARLPIEDKRLVIGDPVRTLKHALAAGVLSELPRATLDGRRVRVLEGFQRTREGRRTVVQGVTYAVDAATFSPVRVILTTRASDPDVPLRLQERLARPRARQLDFAGYERLPSTPQTRRLVIVDVPRSTSTTDQTLAEFRRSIASHGK